MKKDYQEWISAIESRIIDREDKNIFKEVTQCMKSNCYRAAYILSWISLIETRSTEKLTNMQALEIKTRNWLLRI